MFTSMNAMRLIMIMSRALTKAKGTSTYNDIERACSVLTGFASERNDRNMVAQCFVTLVCFGLNDGIDLDQSKQMATKILIKASIDGLGEIIDRAVTEIIAIRPQLMEPINPGNMGQWN